MDRPERTLTFGERPGGLTARAGWTWDAAEDRAEDGEKDTSTGAAAESSPDDAGRRP